MIKRISLLMLILFASIGAFAADDPQTLIEKAMKSYADKNYAASADQLAAAIAAGVDDPNTLYNAACASALAGRTDAALDFVERAVSAGFLNVDQLRNDADLVSLRETPRWPGVIAAAEKAKARQERMWNSPAMSSAFAETLPLDERIAGLSRLWSEAKFNFVHFGAVEDLDWDALYLSYLPRVRAAESTADYYRLLMSFVAQLKDGHTNVQPPRELWARLWSEPALRVSEVEGRYLVTRVDDASLTAISPGMELTHVDGIPVRQYSKDSIIPYVSASTPQDLAQRVARRMLWGPEGSIAKLTLVDASGRTHEQEVRRLNDAERAKLAMEPAPMEYRMLPGNIAYVALNGFGDNKAADAYEAQFEQIAKAGALILDVRRNGGGNSDVGYRILSTLVDKPFCRRAGSHASTGRRTARGDGRKGSMPSRPTRWARAERVCLQSRSSF